MSQIGGSPEPSPSNTPGETGRDQLVQPAAPIAGASRYIPFVPAQVGGADTPVITPQAGNADTPAVPSQVGDVDTPSVPPQVSNPETPASPPQLGSADTSASPPHLGDADTPASPPQDADPSTSSPQVGNPDPPAGPSQVVTAAREVPVLDPIPRLNSLLAAATQVGIASSRISMTGGDHYQVNVFNLGQERTEPPLHQNAGQPVSPRSDESVVQEVARNNTMPTPPLLTLASSRDIYTRHMEVKERGFPLWIPGPNNNLPVEYRKIGVAIGDVGIITKFGSFDFLFNICVPHNDPINRDGVPEGFIPLLGLRPSDVLRHEVFDQGSYLASTSVQNSQREGHLSDTSLTFTTSAGDGAILTMPHGAETAEVASISRFQAYLFRYLESWYKFANGERGRDVENGQLRLVLGCDKTTAWGMATFASTTTSQDTFRLRFAPITSSPTGRMYGWEYSGVAEVRTGPTSREINALRVNDDPEARSTPMNQCLFIRTLTATLVAEVWDKLSSEIDIENGKIQASSSSIHHSSSPSRPSPSSSSTNRPSVRTSEMERGQVLHPSNLVNDLVLQFSKSQDFYQNLKMIIVQDKVWISVLRENDLSLPSAEELVSRIFKSHTLYTLRPENGSPGFLVLIPQEREEATLTELTSAFGPQTGPTQQESQKRRTAPPVRIIKKRFRVDPNSTAIQRESSSAQTSALESHGKAPVRSPGFNGVGTNQMTKALGGLKLQTELSASMFELGQQSIRIHDGTLHAVDEHHGNVRIKSGDEIHQDSANNQIRISSVSVDTPIDIGSGPDYVGIYYRHMGTKGRGLPLWIPRLDRNLPLEYRRKGVSIGDVGLINQFGAFVFLFNLSLPHNHPFNPKDLTARYIPLSIPEDDIHEYELCPAGSYISSDSVEKLSREGDSSGLSFESSTSEGAILAMPFGCKSTDFMYKDKFRRFVALQAEDWYIYANDILGCEAMNGELQVVTGYDKARAWGMAIFSAQEENILLKFRTTAKDNGDKIYSWESTSMAELRAGPDAHEIEELRRDDPSQKGMEYENQTLFIRTLSVILPQAVWNNLGFDFDEPETPSGLPPTFLT